MAKTRSKGPVSPVANKVKSPGKVTKPKKSASTVKKASPKTVDQPEEPEQTAISNESSTSIIPTKVTDKAINELEKYIVREKQQKEESIAQNPNSKSQLFDEDEINENNTLYLMIESKKFFSSKPQFKAKTIKLSKSLYNINNLKTCLFLRDQLVKTSEEIEKIENENLPTIKQILPLKSLKTEYKTFEKRRELRNDYDLFLVDDAILNTLPNVLGKVFFESNNKVPLPIRVTTSSNNSELSLVTLKNQLDKNLNSTFYLPPQGTVISVKVGHLANDNEDSEEVQFTNEELISNITNVIQNFDINTIKTIMIKTGTSPAIPLFYTDKLFNDEDILDDIVDGQDEIAKDELTPFEKGLLQLGDLETVSKVLGKKLGEKKKKKEINGKNGKKVKGKVSKK
ncbi:CIC1 [Candida jiufengensis]|uniref:CIC1 n=1 Tax=Candida jiufengensis TaxID=497108 RepID=UPI002224A4D3|nr:CIC1 [Candida jiufengensis]KAI5956758.1 CIC1 [Candida jiufengensis]